MTPAAPDLAQGVYIIAEIGNNHEGNVAVAEEMIAKAAAAGVNAVKFQTFETERFVSRRDGARFQRLKTFELSHEDFAGLAETARSAGVDFISTPLDPGSAEFLKDHVAAFKIASGDNTFYPMITQIAEFGRPMILSTGLADTVQIRFATAMIRQTWRDLGVKPMLAVLHCVASYPVPPEQANLGAIREMAGELDCKIGYSDHTVGPDAAVLSVGLGARIIEKHFTLDKNYSDFRDHQLSADPGEMADLVRRVRIAEELIGDGDKRAMECEAAAAPLIRRSIAAAHALPAGTVLGPADLMWVRPGDGVPPGKEARLLGRRLRQDIELGDLILPELLDG